MLGAWFGCATRGVARARRPPRRPAHLLVRLGREAGALDAQRDDVLLAQLHLRVRARVGVGVGVRVRVGVGVGVRVRV